MRSKQHTTTESGDLFRAGLDQVINLKHELVQIAGKIDWAWIATRFVIGLLLLKPIYGLSDEGVCERWGHDPYFQYFTEEQQESRLRTPCGHKNART